MSLYRFSGNQSLANQIVLNDVYSVLFCLESNDHSMSESAEHHSLKLYLQMYLWKGKQSLESIECPCQRMEQICNTIKFFYP